MLRTYSELLTLQTFKERYDYLRLNGIVGADTFGHDRYLNQMLYKCPEWLALRPKIIVRDQSCDLAHPDYPANYKPIIHHINPITVQDILERRPCVFDPENLITTTLRTHNAIHYGDAALLDLGPTERKPNDTCLWR